MSDYAYLKRLFQAYYKEKRTEIPEVSFFDHREFGFLSWDQKSFMKRHMSFKNQDGLTKTLIDSGPRHVYSSGALYKQPDNLNMDNKEYQGCDLIIDIDVDHFYTPCKDDHDIWYCKECNKSGKGMTKKCTKCGKTKIKTLNWICEDCLKIAKQEINKLIYNFLIPDFGIKENEINIAFSGHRGYHLKIENEKMRVLTSEERREIVDYLTGENISFEILGLKEKGGIINGLLKGNIGWAQKIMTKMEELLQKPNDEIKKFLLDKRKVGFNMNLVNALLQYKNDFLDVVSKGESNIWAIEGFTLLRWKKFLKGIVGLIGGKIDEPVTIDIHRLIRLPGSLHGKSGFKVQDLTIKDLDNFNPFNETNEKIDPIVFESTNTHKIEILEPSLPITKLKGVKYGPYTKGEVVEVPHHLAVFLLCKDVAKTVSKK